MKISPFNVILALIFGFANAYLAPDKHNHDFNYFSLVCIFILASIFGYYGARFGEIIREKIKPDMIIGDSYLDLMKQNFLWFLLPPLIGALFGSGIGRMVLVFIIQKTIGL